MAAAAPLLPVREHVGGADVAGADGAEVAEAEGAGDEDAEGDGADEVGEKEGEGEGHAGSRVKTCAPGDPGGEDAALHAAEVVGGVLRLGPQGGAVEHEGRVGVEEDEVGRGAGGKAARGEAEQAGRVERQGAPEGGEGEVAGVVELQGGGEEGLEADGAGGGFLEGEALLLLVLRGV